MAIRIIDLIADSETKLKAKEDEITGRLLTSPLFCYKYQLYRLRNLMPDQLGKDLSGSAEGGVVYYPPDVAAELLCEYAGQKCKWVRREKKWLPFTEGNLLFSKMNLRLLPYQRPVLFQGVKVITLDQLSQKYNITLAKAADLFAAVVENPDALLPVLPDK